MILFVDFAASRVLLVLLPEMAPVKCAASLAVVG